MKLAFGIEFNDLYESAGLLRIDAAFLQFLAEADAALRERLVAARSAPPATREESELLIAVAPQSRISSRACSASRPRRAPSPRSTTSSPRSTP